MNTLNIIDYSVDFTEVLEILFAVEPEPPVAPEYVDRHGGDTQTGLSPFITIKWKLPLEDGGSSILGFKVEYSVDGGSWTLAYDGSADRDTRQFKFQGLNQGARYEFRVYSRNAIGDSLTPSDVLEVYAATYPYKMDMLVRGVVVPNASSSTIEITWANNMYSGGQAILGYHLQYNSGYSSSFIEPGVDILYGTNTYTHSDLVAGATYAYRIAAYNLLEADNSFADDELLFSEPLYVIAANEPSQITVFEQPTIGYETGTVSLSWHAPDNNGSEITRYVVTRDVGSGVHYIVYEGIEASYRDRSLM